jgi:molybdenum cofactor cytidylyltransferase
MRLKNTDMPSPLKIAAIILAAGGSTRMGQPKLTLDWHGSPLVRWVAKTALFAECSPVIVVTGADPDDTLDSLAGLPVSYAHNTQWQSGQSSSVRIGIEALPSNVDAALIMLGDQPQIPVKVLRSLIEAYASTTPPPPIIALSVGGRRANPVLFDSAMFAELIKLAGDAGARTIFSRFPVHLIPFDDPDLVLDVDSPEDYQRLMELEPPTTL